MGIVTRKQAEDAVQKWVVALSKLPGALVIISNQNKPQPKTEPYVVIDFVSRVGSENDEHSDPVEVSENVYDLPILSRGEITFTIGAYGKTAADVLATIHALRRSDLSRNTLAAGGLVYRRDIDISDAAALIDSTENSPDAAIDVTFAFTDIVSNGSAIIESAEVTPTYKAPDGTIIEQETETIPEEVIP